MWRRPNGLLVGRMRIPLGVIGIIYESRPNVTVDAAALCLKAGNAVILRGGSEAINSNTALSQILRGVLRVKGLPENAIQLIPMVDREAVNSCSSSMSTSTSSSPAAAKISSGPLSASRGSR